MGLLVALRGPAALHGRPTLLSDRDAGRPEHPAAPSAAGRAGDLAALALIVGGTALFFYARNNLERLSAGQIVRVEGRSAVEQAIHFDRLSKVGLGTAAVGIVLAVVLFLRQRRRAASTSPR